MLLREDTICEISRKKKLLLISNLEHSHLIDCMSQLRLGALCFGISNLEHSHLIDCMSQLRLGALCFGISNLEHSHLIDCMSQLRLGALCFGIYKWAQSDKNDKRANSVAVSEADLSLYIL